MYIEISNYCVLNNHDIIFHSISFLLGITIRAVHPMVTIFYVFVVSWRPNG